MTTIIVIDKQQLVAKTSNKLPGLVLNGSFLSLLGRKQPSFLSSCVQERVNEGRGQRFGSVAKNFARALHAHLAYGLWRMAYGLWLMAYSTYLPQILDTPLSTIDYVPS